MKINADRQLQLINLMMEKCFSINKLDKENFQNIFNEISEEYSIAVIKAQLFSQLTKEYLLYKYPDEEPGEDSAQYDSTVDQTKARVICYSRKGVKWQPEEKRFLNFICMLLSCALARTLYCQLSKDLYYYDFHTGLPNANSIKKLGRELRLNGTISGYTALLINIKGTNYLNKKIGYAAVTNIIKEYAEIIKNLLDENEMIARINEDNFFVLVKDNKKAAILDVIDGREVTYKHKEKTYVYNIQARAGVYSINESSDDFEKIFRCLAMTVNYARNVSHEDVIICTDELDKKIVKMLGYTQMFRESLEKGDFFVVYQPKVLTTDNSVYGGEALVRWKYDGEVIMPSSFIETLEREHLICRLDWFVLEHTCRNIKKWLDNGITPVRISVNFSNDHLHEIDITNRVIQIVDKYNIPHQYIEIEITETVESEDMNRLFEFVTELRKNGFHVAIDDFGIGYSSLHLLNSVTVDVLKIDKTFVNRITDTNNKRERIILENIINMAFELGIEVVAEGVETKPQIEALKELSCYRIQGFIFDKPLSEQEFMERLSIKKYG